MISKGTTSMSNPELQEIMDLSDNLPHSTTPNSRFITIILKLENAQRDYPELNIERAPAVMVFNHEDMVLKTYSMKEAKEFFKRKGIKYGK
jgi:hypothetical protein